MSRTRLTIDELWDSLRRQIRFLTSSMAAVESGSEDEGVRIAVVLRVLLHDTRRSASLLAQLGLKDRLPFIDTRARPEVEVFGVTEGGEQIALSGGLGLAQWDRLTNSWRAPGIPEILDRPKLGFEEWWRTPCMPGTGIQDPICRWELVDFMAHQDGGAHVDPDGLDDRYRHLVVAGGGALYTIPGDYVDGLPEGLDPALMQTPDGDAAAISVLQIAYEVCASLAEFDDTSGLFAP